MRKFTFFLVPVILLILMAVPAFAGDKSICTPFKKGEPNYLPGLYGLCVAYQNADEDGKQDIFKNWQKKVGEDGLPQLPGFPYPEEPGDGDPPVDENEIVACPCWSAEHLLAATCQYNLTSSFVDGFFDFAQYDSGNVLFVADATSDVMQPNGSCLYQNAYDPESNALLSVTVEESETCHADVALLANEALLDLCILP